MVNGVSWEYRPKTYQKLPTFSSARLAACYRLPLAKWNHCVCVSVCVRACKCSNGGVGVSFGARRWTNKFGPRAGPMTSDSYVVHRAVQPDSPPCGQVRPLGRTFCDEPKQAMLPFNFSGITTGFGWAGKCEHVVIHDPQLQRFRVLVFVRVAGNVNAADCRSLFSHSLSNPPVRNVLITVSSWRKPGARRAYACCNLC